MTQSAPLSLFRALIKEARRVPDYNFRSYAIRRVKAGFDRNRHLQGEEAIASLNDGRLQLEILRKQASLGQMYPSERSVME